MTDQTKLPTIVEPYKIKSVEPLYQLTYTEREQKLLKAGLNVFNLRSRDVFIDLLTDSGTGAMSQFQWSALMSGDESYAGSYSFEILSKTIHELFGYQHVIPSHQGRSAELVIMTALTKPDQIIPSNMHFDTTTAHIENAKCVALDLPCKENESINGYHDFKGNIDLEGLENILSKKNDQIPFVTMVLTCNSGGGQPVSIDNLKAVRKLCDQYNKPLWIDAARILENCYFIKLRDPNYKNKSIKEILLATCACADGMWMSAKKDGLVNIGGFIATRHEEIFNQLRIYTVLFDGYITYGGQAGRDIAALEVGLREATDEAYLAHRVGQIAYLGAGIRNAGVDIIWPTGGHAVYIDAHKFLPHIPPEQYRGWALSCALYIEDGLRTVEIGPVMRGRDPKTGENRLAGNDLVRLAVPRRVYTQGHLDFIIRCVANTKEKASKVRGVKFLNETPVLRHFTSTFEFV